MPAPANLVQEISSSNGLGNFTLTAVDGRQTFDQAFGIGGLDLFDYFITSRDNGEWEVGTGHLLNATTLVRDTVLESSNSDSPVNFTAGTMDVTNDVPAFNQARLDGDQIFLGVNTFTDDVIIDGVNTTINSTDVRIRDNSLIIGNVVSPTDATADGGGITLLGDTNKTIAYDEVLNQWVVGPGLVSPFLAATTQLSTPGGEWLSNGLLLNAASFLSIDGKEILIDNAGNIELKNINVIDATTSATIAAAVGGGNVTTSDTLTAMQLLLGNGSKDIVTEPALTYDGACFDINADVDIGPGSGLSMAGVVVLSETTGISLDNIAQINPTTLATFEAAITALESHNLTLNNVISPTDILADGGGITLLGDTDHTFIWDLSRDQWYASLGLASANIEFDDLLIAPSGLWDIDGIKLGQSKLFSVNGRTVLSEFDGDNTLSNIDVIEGLTAIVITASLGLATPSARGAVIFATAAEFQSNSANIRGLESNRVWDAQLEVALTSTANSVAWDMGTGFNFDIDTLGENTTIANPTNADIGKSGHLRIVQDGTGTRTVAWGTNFEFAGGVAPTASTDPAAEDMFFYKVISSTRILISSLLDIS